MILITRPNHDLATTYLCAFSEEIINFCFKKNVKCVDLKGEKATKKIFDSYIKKNKPRFIFLNGHGSESEIGGFDNEILINKYQSDYSRSIIFSRSCQSANKLGLLLVNGGLEAFIGYKKNYVVMLLRKRNTTPVLDSIAKLFLEPSNLIAMSLIKGNSVKEADQKSRRALIKNLREVLSSKMRDRDDVAAYLFHDLNCQTIIGNIDAKIN